MSVSLTRFIDFVNATGLKKRTVVSQASIPDKYEPYKDFYKKLRETIIAMHKNGEPIKNLSQKILTFNFSRTKHYRELIKGYQAWAAGKKIQYIRDDSRTFELNKLELSINPELILKIRNKPTVIKLYFKEPPLTKSSADLIVTLLSVAFGVTDEYKDYDFAVLDIRRSKFYRLTPSVQVIKILETLKIEASSWLSYQNMMP